MLILGNKVDIYYWKEPEASRSLKVGWMKDISAFLFLLSTWNLISEVTWELSLNHTAIMSYVLGMENIKFSISNYVYM